MEPEAANSKIDYIHQPSKLKDVIKSQLGVLTSRTELIVLFGSLVTGNFHIRSDVDILVVSDSVGLKEIRSLLDPILTKIGIYYDLLLLTVEEFNNYERSPILHHALRGEIVWESERITNMMPNNM